MTQLQLEYGRGDVLAEKYEVVDRLDESPLGITYRVRHLKHGTYLRLLMLDPKVAGKEQKQAIIEAFKLARSLQHKNLIKYGELGQHQGVAFVTMEDFEGQQLSELVGRVKSEAGEFTLREAAQIVIQISEAAKAVHAEGHTLRSLRPENVLVNLRRTGPSGKNVVVDVKFAGAGMLNLVPLGALAEDEFTRGEAQYLAPELKSIAPNPDARSDVYSAGVIFYELLIGSPPLGTYQLPRQRRPDLPPHVDDVVELALSPAPEDRYPSAADFIADVQRCFQGVPEEDVATPRGVSWVVWALGAAVVLSLVAILASQSASDPYELALAADNTMRKQVMEAHPRPSPEDIRTVLANHPPNMMYIPAGDYVSGRLQHESKAIGGDPASVKALDGFLIDVFEYPNLASAPPKFGVSWSEANQTCEDQGKRLCTADEFEKACRGPENYVYGYGDTYDPDFCGPGIDEPHNSGQFPECKSSWGVYDVAGNFREWTATAHGSGGSRVVVKGGLPQSTERGTRCAYSTDLSKAYGDDTLSFRCCRDVDAPKWEPPAEEPAEGSAE